MKQSSIVNCNQLDENADSWFSMPQKEWFLVEGRHKISSGMDSWFSPDYQENLLDLLESRKSNIELVFTKDPDLLKQYYNLREKSYRQKLGFDKYSGAENDFDKKSDIVVGLQNGKVVAGARIDFSNRQEFMYNDQPKNNFFYKDLLKKYDPNFNNDLYSEICGLVIGKQVRDNLFFPKFFDSLVNYCKKVDCRYVVGVSYPIFCKRSSMMFERLGYNFKVFYDTEYPFDNAKHGNELSFTFYPIVIKLY